MSEREDTAWRDAGWGSEYQDGSHGKHYSGETDGEAISCDPPKNVIKVQEATHDGPSYSKESSATEPDFGTW